MTRAIDPDKFAKMWEAAWNKHDVEEVLTHFHDDVVFRSPVAMQVVPSSNGVVRGKAALRAYWMEALTRVPDLAFAVDRVFAGVDTLVIQYRNQRDVRCCEVLIFDEDRVSHGSGTYLAHHANPAGLDD